MVVTLLPSSSIDPLASEIIPTEEILMKEFQNEEEILTGIAGLNLRNDTDEDLVDARNR
jgi:hypothetical protein